MIMELDHEFTVPVPVDRAWSVLLDVERVASCMPGATLDSVDGDEYAGRMKVKVGAMTITYRGTARIVAADEPSRTVTMEASAKEARGSGTASATVQAKLHQQEDGTTLVSVRTKLNVTGRPAQFGRNILSEVGSKIIARFAKALAAELESPAEPEAPEAGAAAPAEPVQEVVPVPETPAEEPAPVPEPAVEKAAEPEQAPEPEPAKAEVARPAPAAPPRHAAPSERPPLRLARDDDAIDLLEVAGPSLVKRAVPAAGGLVVLLLLIRWLVRRRRR
ncbi:SRPBCC family protein [Actinomadura nitritigenes]|uniref:SRPBCC family protein n=1 Tax=Actinomadura nitritigenes TaxID=134602 RepID=A0ABS3R1C5_9ACTN|nr:SRPBCC family protein [Actinomadura nitritigenes]MBO2440035.1 SRPBCC family protein [Actinomadura nitritigenes]